MLKQRILTAAIGIPLLFALFAYAPQWILIMVFMGFVALSTYETAHMLMPRLESYFAHNNTLSQARIEVPLARILFSIGLGLIVFGASSAGSAEAGRGMIVSALLATIIVGAFSSKNVDLAMGRLLGFLITVSYGALPWLAIWELYLLGDGTRYLWLLLAVVWMGDSGAYFGGSYFGRHKLAPSLSPHKTWEGALCGMLASVGGGFLMNLLFAFGLGSSGKILACSIFGAIFGQLGDLVESMLKRFAQVKDSGTIFPGHGGFLDRTDGLLFAAPVIWFILYNF